MPRYMTVEEIYTKPNSTISPAKMANLMRKMITSFTNEDELVSFQQMCQRSPALQTFQQASDAIVCQVWYAQFTYCWREYSTFRLSNYGRQVHTVVN